MFPPDIEYSHDTASDDHRVGPLAYASCGGPFDLIGDIHGCLLETEDLLTLLGYQLDLDAGFRHPAGRQAIFLGDLVDRGPNSPGVVSLVAAMVAGGTGLDVMGNHDDKIMRYLGGARVNLSPSAQLTLDQYAALGEPSSSTEMSIAYHLFSLVPHHLVLDGGRLVVAHAGLPGAFHGKTNHTARSLALYGQRMKDEYGAVIPYSDYRWENDYSGDAIVVQGHVPVDAIQPINRVWKIDTGCVFGGRLSALRYPEMMTVEVPARHCYSDPY